jgi:hypothetical protein
MSTKNKKMFIVSIQWYQQNNANGRRGGAAKIVFLQSDLTGREHSVPNTFLTLHRSQLHHEVNCMDQLRNPDHLAVPVVDRH